MHTLYTKEEKESKLLPLILLVTNWGSKSYTERGIQLKIKPIHWLLRLRCVLKAIWAFKSILTSPEIVSLGLKAQSS